MAHVRGSLSFLLLLMVPRSAFPQDVDPQKRLLETFDQVTKTYPADSVSLRRMYFEWGRAQDAVAMQEQTARLEGLLSEATRKTYHAIQTDLKPIMQAMLSSKSLTRRQVRRFVALYSAYDHYEGEALFSNLLREGDTYRLVYGTMRRLAGEARHDTSCIAALIALNDTIRTNAELAEGMEDFVVEAVRNNPKGFLQLYITRDEAARKDLAHIATLYDESPEDLRPLIHKAAASSPDERLRKAEQELLRFAKEQE